MVRWLCAQWPEPRSAGNRRAAALVRPKSNTSPRSACHHTHQQSSHQPPSPSSLAAVHTRAVPRHTAPHCMAVPATHSACTQQQGGRQLAGEGAAAADHLTIRVFPSKPTFHTCSAAVICNPVYYLHPDNHRLPINQVAICTSLPDVPPVASSTTPAVQRQQGSFPGTTSPQRAVHQPRVLWHVRHAASSRNTPVAGKPSTAVCLASRLPCWQHVPHHGGQQAAFAAAHRSSQSYQGASWYCQRNIEQYSGTAATRMRRLAGSCPSRRLGSGTSASSCGRLQTTIGTATSFVAAAVAAVAASPTEAAMHTYDWRVCCRAVAAC